MKLSLIHFLSLSSNLSRRQIFEKIKRGHVTVDEKVILDAKKIINSVKNVVRVDGKIIKKKSPVVILFHKPTQVIVSKFDQFGRRTIYDYLPREYRVCDPVGRLDYWSSGLLVITNDGELNYLLSHPKNKVPKVYLVKVAGKLEEKDVRKVLLGVLIDGKIVKFDDLKIISSDGNNSWLEVTISVGHNRVIRKVFDKLYHPVLKLKRIRVGPFKLGGLKPGEFKVLDHTQYSKAARTLIPNLGN